MPIPWDAFGHILWHTCLPPLAAPTPCTAEALQCCHAKTNHIKSHLYPAQLHEQRTTLPLSCYTPRRPRRPSEGISSAAFSLLHHPGHSEDPPYRRATFVATARAKPAVLLVSTTQAMHQCEQPLMRSQPLLGDILGILGMVLYWEPLGALFCLVFMSISSIQHAQGALDRLLIGQTHKHRAKREKI